MENQKNGRYEHITKKIKKAEGYSKDTERKKKKMKICKVVGCENKSYSYSGYCKTHQEERERLSEVYEELNKKTKEQNG